EAACRRGSYDQPIAIRALKRAATERYGPEKLLAEVGTDRFRQKYLDQAGSGVCDALDEIQRLMMAVRSPDWKRAEGKPVAIIGGGPAGLACGHDLALMGIPTVIFEAEPVAAGMLALGVPEYRLPRDLIRAEVQLIEALGVEIRCSTEIGKEDSFGQLRRDYAAVGIAVRGQRSRKINIPGVDGPTGPGGLQCLP